LVRGGFGGAVLGAIGGGLVAMAISNLSLRETMRRGITTGEAPIREKRQTVA
jgi:hypothetical protein